MSSRESGVTHCPQNGWRKCPRVLGKGLELYDQNGFREKLALKTRVSTGWFFQEAHSMRSGGKLCRRMFEATFVNPSPLIIC